jgi:hypothetical protein
MYAVDFTFGCAGKELVYQVGEMLCISWLASLLVLWALVNGNRVFWLHAEEQALNINNVG